MCAIRPAAGAASARVPDSRSSRLRGDRGEPRRRLGVLTQAAAVGLILIMFGSIQKKIFVWKTGFWGEKSSGWHYDLMMIVMNLVILTTGGGRYVLF